METWPRRVLAYWFASWHLRQPPLATASREERARWCRDHCGTFAGRWFALGAGLWLLFSTPFVPYAAVGIVGIVGLVMGMWHITWQILAQKRAGPPFIEPPAEFPRRDGRDDDEKKDAEDERRF